ncbi:ATP-dependent DNA helicase PIF1 [Nephila pilipes]|uniref:ATP-dependent DNA helicase n=2 Tax=Nephila pilipes TaxID=299642 RepID=A0A8X6PT68_NEPPI|nr:ATP-dependent DNA helicase PIF1 [Nephila pilipes]
MALRNIPAAVRTPYFSVHNDAENYFYSLLVQYVPFNKESELLERYPNSRDAFLDREKKFFGDENPFLSSIRERSNQLENAFRQAQALEILQNPEDYVPEEIPEEEVPVLNMTDEQFRDAQNVMNVQQRELLNIITRGIENQMRGDSSRFLIFVTGGAGVGKTFTFNTLKEKVNRIYKKNVVKVAALTGVAAILVGGSTLHSMFKLPFERDGKSEHMGPLTGVYLEVLSNRWRDIKFLFIDEISMVPYKMLYNIDTRLRQLKNNLDEPFGGINVIVFGDLMQLPPVRGLQVFQKPNSQLLSLHLWRLFGLVELTQNMRQQGDTSFVDLLNALRVGKMEAKHFDILISKKLNVADLEGDFALPKAIRIYPTNKMVDELNHLVVTHYRNQGAQIFKIKAQDELLDRDPRNNTNMDKLVPKDINKTGGIPHELEIFVGVRVMLRYNVLVEGGLVNGVMGVITQIFWPNYRRDQMYDNDIPDLQIEFDRIGIHRLTPIAVKFPAVKNKGTIERRMLPIVLCWACTVHKMQGCTVDKAVINLGSNLFADGQAYVALSRLRSLDGLRIEDLDCLKLTGTTPCNEDALEEMERMRKYPPAPRP